VDTGKRIIPALIFNTRKVLPADKVFYAMPHKVEIHFLPAISVKENETAELLKERVFNVMSDYYLKNA
jgi:1-acyl-sn-glycerol-3-phosphate acyltransferase